MYDGSKATYTEDLALRAPAADEVVVRIHAAGLCHSDLSVIDGTIPFPTPVVLGHEGAGVVEEVGPLVRGVSPGDHVVLTTLGNCGACAACDSGQPTLCRASFGRRGQPFTWAGRPAYSFANTSVFCERTVVRAGQAVPIPADVPLAVACLVGCGVLTGIGAVLHRARVRPGSTVVVIGVGGIGLNVIQGARLAGAARIVAVDVNPRKEELARALGATDFVDPSAAGPAPAGTAPEGSATAGTVAAVRAVLPAGADYVFECVGQVGLIRAAIDLLDWGGSCVLLGVPPVTAEASFNVSGMYLDKAILGCRYGTSQPHRDIPAYLELYRTGRLQLDELVTRRYPLTDLDRAVADMARGELARGVFEL
ncbi:MAG: alcohol dehydrogenase catalytic domain-containing protein [Mycobacteriales bacterium]